MDQGDAWALAVHGVTDGLAHEALGPGRGDGLDADAGGIVHLGPELVPQKGDEPLGLGRTRGVFDAGVDVLGVLAENDHIHEIRAFDRGFDAFEILDGPDAGIEVQHLAHGAPISP